MRAISVVGIPSLLIRFPRGASGVYKDGVNLHEFDVALPP